MDKATAYNARQGLDAFLVKEIQRLTGALVDGDLGPSTAERVASWQGRNGLLSDGKIGPATLRAMREADVRVRLCLDSRRCSSADVADAYPDLTQVIDLSFHQDDPESSADDIEWDLLVEDSGADAFIFKASEGRGYRDPMFCYFRRMARERGLLWGAYHYAHLAWGGRATDPLEQAEHFVRTTGAHDDPRPLFLDLERKTLRAALKCMTLDEVEAWVRSFLDEVDRRTPRPCGIYWSQGQIREFLTVEVAERLRGERPTWWPYYPRHVWPFERRDASTRPPKHPAGFGWTLWQYSGEGRAPGIRGRVDLNIFNGTRSELRDFFEGVAWTGTGC